MFRFFRNIIKIHDPYTMDRTIVSHHTHLIHDQFTQIHVSTSKNKNCQDVYVSEFFQFNFILKQFLKSVCV